MKKLADAIAILDKKRPGAWFKIKIAKEHLESAKARKDGHEVMKITEATVRYGIGYNSQKAVMAKTQNTTPSAKAGRLAWGSYKPGYEGKVIEYNGKDYIRFYPSPNKAKVTFLIDGQPATYEEVKNSGYVNDSYFNRKSGESDCFTICVDNILKIY